ncbi:MAG: hypothetical protein NTU47_01125 [Ignavibacteriales bacterium]|nr:hypothetical protein [Ignavibacteriales bacterium]
MIGMMGLWNTDLDIPWKEILSGILTYLYSIAHYVGMFVVYLLGRVLPAARVPADLIDPIGYLALLTAFLILVQVAKKIAWILVVVAWALILVRIAMGLFGY